MRISALIDQLEKLSYQRFKEAQKRGLRLNQIGKDIFDPEIVVEHAWGKIRCGTGNATGIQSIRTINNTIVITLDQ
jgi:hypothetical protein